MASNSTHSFEQRVAQQWQGYAFSTTRKLLAVSGGADSVALLRAMHAISPEQMEVAHFNHQWRGDESDGDQAFVRSLCRELGIPFHTNDLDSNKNTSRLEQSESESDVQVRSEDLARRHRYAFLESTAYRIGARCVLTAHTASDRVETMLHNLFRGTGLAGVASMTRVRPLGEELLLVRPMLTCNRSDVLEYLGACEQSYRNDSSNSDVRYKRNFLRRKLLPIVESEYGTGTQERMLQFAEIAEEATTLIQELAQAYLEKVALLRQQAGDVGRCQLTRIEGEQLVLPDQTLCPVQWPVLREALVFEWHRFGWPVGKMNASHWETIRAVHAGLEAWKEPIRTEAAEKVPHQNKAQHCKGTNAAPTSLAGRSDASLPLNLPGNLSLSRRGSWIVVARS